MKNQANIKMKNKIFEVEIGSKFLSFLREEGLASFPCGGKGICGKCQIQFLTGAPMPLPNDRKLLSPDRLREGYRLACTAIVRNDCEIAVQESQIDILASKGYEEIEGKKGEKTVIAIDLGTTTIAMEQRGIESGKVYGRHVSLNPQRIYGDNVISRMEEAVKGKEKELQQLILEEIEKGIRHLVSITMQVPELSILSGNTAMIHLWQGYDVSKLCRFPFRTISLGQEQTEVFGVPVLSMPGISAFVGGDIVSGLYKISLFHESGIKLFIDLGTNGEMALGDEVNGYLCTATAAGPAFEGGVAKGTAGSDMVAILGKMLEEKIIDETGLLKKSNPVDGVELTQQDIRNLQMAKAAIYAGIHILLKKSHISYEEIAHVYLAGGFGYYLDVDCAIRIGLIPKQLEGKVRAVGNTSLEGAFEYAKYLVKRKNNQEEREVSRLPEHIVDSASVINLAEEMEFQDIYLENLNFPTI